MLASFFKLKGRIRTGPPAHNALEMSLYVRSLGWKKSQNKYSFGFLQIVYPSLPHCSSPPSVPYPQHALSTLLNPIYVTKYHKSCSWSNDNLSRAQMIFCHFISKTKKNNEKILFFFLVISYPKNQKTTGKFMSRVHIQPWGMILRLTFEYMGGLC